MSIHVCKCVHNGHEEFHLRYPGLTEKQAQDIADLINSGKLDQKDPLPPLSEEVKNLSKVFYSRHGYIYETHVLIFSLDCLMEDIRDVESLLPALRAIPLDIVIPVPRSLDDSFHSVVNDLCSLLDRDIQLEETNRSGLIIKDYVLVKKSIGDMHV